MAPSTAPRPPFSPRRRAAVRALAAGAAGGDFIAADIDQALAERLAMLSRRFGSALVIGAAGPAVAAALVGRADQVTAAELDEAALLAGAAGHDLVVWPGGLDSINAVPPVLAALRATLPPDGLVLGALVGDGSFPALRRLLTRDGVRAIARMHPQIDVRTMGNLLQHAGFALPVVDVDVLDLRYGDWRGIARDLRVAGLRSMLNDPPPPLRRDEVAALDRAFAAAADAGGRVAEQVRLIHFSGWAPAPSQPQPARRGSAGASLAAALRPRQGTPAS